MKCRCAGQRRPSCRRWSPAPRSVQGEGGNVQVGDAKDCHDDDVGKASSDSFRLGLGFLPIPRTYEPPEIRSSTTDVGRNTLTMGPIVLLLLAVWIVLSIIGFVINGLFWLFVIGIILVVAIAGWAWFNRSA